MVNPSNEILEASRGMASIAAAVQSQSERAALAYLAIYACGYTGRGTLDAFASVGAASMDTAFVADLAGKVYDERTLSGWTITGWNGQSVFLRKDGIRTFVSRSRLEEDLLGIGNAATFSLPFIEPGRMPGFVMRKGIRSGSGRPISRLYLNIQPAGAAWVLGPLARLLDDKGLPFELKVLAHPRAYLRRDACVLYVISERLDEAFDVVHQAVSFASVSLSDSVPLFTRRLACGIGYADDPSAVDMGEQSHGQWVSNLFVSASTQVTGANEIAHAVMEEIRKCGRDPHRPFLRAGHHAGHSASEANVTDPQCL